MLTLGPGLEIPEDAVTQSFALLAMKGAGKSNAAVVIAEEMYARGLPWVAIDPKGDWHGMRSSRDGRGPGLPIPVLGGLHGDLPLDPGAGMMVADLIVDQNLTCILDVSEFPSKASQARFLTALGDRLFRRHGKDPQPRHLFLEEADEYVPQRVMGDMAQCVGMWCKIVKQGRSRGLGITLISQRSAVVNKDALTQTETLIAMRATSPQDRKAITNWVDYHGAALEVDSTLPTLKAGEAWIASPHWLGNVFRVAFRQRATFDSGATPKMGAKRRPSTIADVDLDALRVQMAEAVETAEANDPAKLRKRIAELEREVKARKPETVERVVEVQVVDQSALQALAAVRALVEAEAQRQDDAWGEIVIATLEVAPPEMSHQDSAATLARKASADARARVQERAAARGPVRPMPPPPPPPGTPADLPKQARAMLEELCRRAPMSLTRTQLATFSGYSRKSSQFGPSVRMLVGAGLVMDVGGKLAPTDQGVAVTGISETMPDDPVAVLEMWVGKLPKAAGVILSTLATHGAMSLEEIAEQTGYSLNSSQFRPMVRVLADHGLVTVRGVLVEPCREVTG